MNIARIVTSDGELIEYATLTEAFRAVKEMHGECTVEATDKHGNWVCVHTQIEPQTGETT